MNENDDDYYDNNNDDINGNIISMKVIPCTVCQLVHVMMSSSTMLGRSI